MKKYKYQSVNESLISAEFNNTSMKKIDDFIKVEKRVDVSNQKEINNTK